LELSSSTGPNLFGVANGVYSWRHTQAGESTTGVGNNAWETSFWYRTPDVFTNPTAGDTLIQFNPAFRPTDADPANRYAFFGVTCANFDTVTFNCLAGNTAYNFVLSGFDTPTTGTDLITVSGLTAATWYQIEYAIVLNDGLVNPRIVNGNGNNDVFTVRVFDVFGTQLGTSTGAAWEAPWQVGDFDGVLGPRIINSMDFLRRQGPVDVSLGFIDNFAGVNEIPEPSTFALGAGALAVLAALRRRTR